MYRIQPAAGEQWAIVDERDESVYVGSLRGCEDWLDFQENVKARLPVEEKGWWRRLWRLFRKSPASRESGGKLGEVSQPNETEQ
jgi:hypothetical protein